MKQFESRGNEEVIKQPENEVASESISDVEKKESVDIKQYKEDLFWWELPLGTSMDVDISGNWILTFLNGEQAWIKKTPREREYGMDRRDMGINWSVNGHEMISKMRSYSSREIWDILSTLVQVTWEYTSFKWNFDLDSDGNITFDYDSSIKDLFSDNIALDAEKLRTLLPRNPWNTRYQVLDMLKILHAEDERREWN